GLAGRSGASSLASFSGGGSGSGAGGGGGGGALATGAGGGGAGFGAGGAGLGVGVEAALGAGAAVPDATPCGSRLASLKAEVTVGVTSDGVMGISGRMRRARAM